MVTFDDIVKAVSDEIPDFNRYALKDFVEENINSCPDFLALVFREGFKMIDADIELKSWKVLSPEDRAEFELTSRPSKSQKSRVPITTSHLMLVRYTVRVGDQYAYATLYTPYLFDDMLFIHGKRSMIRKVLLEKTISKIKNGVSVSPIRVNLQFLREKTFDIESYSEPGATYRHFLVSADMFNGSTKSKTVTITIIHYLLAKFGFLKTLKRFGISKNDVNFAETVGDDTDKYTYFAANKNEENPNLSPTLFLRVKKSVLADDRIEKFVVNLMYVLTNFNFQTIDNVYVEQGSIWKTVLGMLTFSDKSHGKANQNAETHLRSADTFIDPITQKRFETFGIPIKDIYDLIVYIFERIDVFMVENLSQDIYNCKLDVSNGILVNTLATKIFLSLYQLGKKTNISVKDVQRAINFNAMIFKISANNKDNSEHYIAPPEIIGDNYLFSGGLNKIRLGGSAEQRLHPSMLVVESINAIVGKHIGKNGYMNPYVATDSYGSILHPDYAKEVDEIEKYLPN